MLATTANVRCRIVATDLDGTLLRSNGEISQLTRHTIREASEQGILIVLVTARPIEATRRIAQQLNAEAVICLSGAVTYDVALDRIQDVVPLRIPQVRLLREEIRHVCDGVAMGYETPKGRHLEPRWKQSVSGLSSERVTCLLNDNRFPRDSILTVLASCNYHAGSCLENWVTVSGMRWGTAFSPAQGIVEITTPSATKAAALARACKQWGFASQEVIAFGDSLNDLAMLEWAGRGVAVANAHDRLREMADITAPSNDTDGVAHALQMLLQDQVIFSSSMSCASSRLHHIGESKPAHRIS